jgi:MFS family permease
VFFTAQYLQVGLGQDALGAGLRLLPWGIVPLLIAPWSGRLADQVGERPLVTTGLLLQAAGLAWIAAIAAPGLAYPDLLVPMIIVGLGFTLAVPAVTRAVVGSVPATDIGKASGAFTTMRQLGGAFGVAILAAAFATAGGYASPAVFSDGYVPAVATAAGLALAGAAAALALSGRPAQRSDATVHEAKSERGAAVAAATRLDTTAVGLGENEDHGTSRLLQRPDRPHRH